MLGHGRGEYIESMHPGWLTGIFSALPTLPSQCAVCHAWPAEPVCGDCQRRFLTPATARCSTCAIRVPDAIRQCGACLRHPLLLDSCHAAVDYAYPWAELLGSFKFHDQPAWARVLATMMRTHPLVRSVLDGADLVIPIPLARERLLERGYNQAQLLAKHLASAKLNTRLLLRVRPTHTQSRLSRAERLRNLRGALAIEPLQIQALAQRNIVLVDDVMTTGATLQACATALRQAGAAQVHAIVFARTPAP
jgi:ComF family protein